MTAPPRPLMIGDFARRCRLPVSTLRYYDKIGLLTPAVVDASNGYRRYAADQLATAVLIARLRAVGTAPHDIAAVLLGGAQATAVLAAQRRRIAGQISEGQRALAEVDDLLTHHHEHPVQDVELISLARVQVAVARFHAAHTNVTSAVLRGIAALRSALRRAGYGRTGPWGASFPLEITEQVGGFVFARTSTPIDSHILDSAWLPEARAVRGVHLGAADTLALTYHAALNMIERQGATATGPVIEEYLALDASPTTPRSIQLTVPLASQHAGGIHTEWTR